MKRGGEGRGNGLVQGAVDGGEDDVRGSAARRRRRRGRKGRRGARNGRRGGRKGRRGGGDTRRPRHSSPRCHEINHVTCMLLALLRPPPIRSASPSPPSFPTSPHLGRARPPRLPPSLPARHQSNSPQFLTFFRPFQTFPFPFLGFSSSSLPFFSSSCLSSLRP